jgi:hypothetical protein
MTPALSSRCLSDFDFGFGFDAQRARPCAHCLKKTSAKAFITQGSKAYPKISACSELADTTPGS